MKKYIPGKPIDSLDELMTKDFIIFHDKTYSRGWFQSWQLYYTMNQIKQRRVFEALLKTEQMGDMHYEKRV